MVEALCEMYDMNSPKGFENTAWNSEDYMNWQSNYIKKMRKASGREQYSQLEHSIEDAALYCSIT